MTVSVDDRFDESSTVDGRPDNGDKPATDHASRGVANALRELLTTKRPYRSLWEPLVIQRSAQDLNRSAVARVLADYLVEAGELRDQPGLHRQIKDRIGRALNGQGVSTETLRWFIAAFQIDDEDAARLWLLSHGESTVSSSSPPSEIPVLPARAKGWQTVSLHELHLVGPNGRPQSHRTVQVIRALTSGFSIYPYRFDTATATVEVVRGGTAGPVTESGGGLSSVDIHLTSPLALGETASLEYITRFQYESLPPPELRRGITGWVDNLEIWVQFHPQHLPRQVWWGRWDRLDGPVQDREAIELDREHSAHRYLAHLEQTIVGFVWSWD